MVFSLTIPATIGLILLAEPIIRLIFEHGAFTALDTHNTAQALTYYAYGLFAYSAVKIMVPVFYALNDTKYPVMGSFIAVGVNITLISLTIDSFSFKAIALSTSCSMALNFLFLGIILYRKLTGFSLPYLFLGIAKILLASSAMALGVIGLERMLSPLLSGTITLQLIAVFLVIGAAALLYTITLHFLRLPEMTFITDKLKQRFGSR
jgi:putative peptidoglycan lipid II flippase